MTDQDPANPQPFRSFPSEAVRQRLDERLRSLPIQDAIRQSLSKELGTLLNAETLNATFRDLVTGRTSLDQSLQQLATRASQVLNTVMEAEQQRSDEEDRISQQFQETLQQDQNIDPADPTIILPVEQAEIAQEMSAQDPPKLVDQVRAVNRKIAHTHTQYQHLQAQAMGNALKIELAQFLKKS
jgi:hypothetical protein